MALALLGAVPAAVNAQDAPPPIGPFIVDLRATFPMFPSNDGGLASSRAQGPGGPPGTLQAVTPDQLPGRGFGIAVGAHAYPFRWRHITLGIGGELMTSRARQAAQVSSASGSNVSYPGVTSHFTSLAPQGSLNFGSGAGWSYLSVGGGKSMWSVVPDGSAATPADQEWRTTINFGGGARWFPRHHLSVGFDIRQYAISLGMPQVGAQAGLPPSPKTTLTVIAAGVSVR
jgi:hypothetical protein